MTNLKNKKFTCCFCGKKFNGFGNNPYPVHQEDGSKCCDYCNMKLVIPARLSQLKGE